MIQGSTFVITGGAGFIGTALTRVLAPNNRIRIVDILRRNALAEAGLDTHPNVELVKADVRDFDAMTAAIADADYVIHMASIAGVDTVLKNPVLTMEISLEGTMNMLRAVKAAGRAKRVIDFSTSEVFGQYAFRVREADVTSLGAVGEARWTYAVSKLATEHLAHCYFKQFGIPTVAVRPFNIFGPGQIGEGAVHAFVTRAIRNEPITIHNDGDQIRSWCYIDDIVRGILAALEAPGAVGESFNIGNPRSTVTIHQLAQMVIRLAKSSSEIKFIDWDFPDVELRVPDVKKAERLLGFRAEVDLEDGLERTIGWYRERIGNAQAHT